MGNSDGGSGWSNADCAEEIAERRAGGFNLDKFLGRTPPLPPLPDGFQKISILRLENDGNSGIAPVELTATNVRNLIANMWYGGDASRQVLRDWFREQTNCPDGNHFEVGMPHPHDESRIVIFDANFSVGKFNADSVPKPLRIDFVFSAPITV